MYQCFVSNEWEQVQSTSELQLGGKWLFWRRGGRDCGIKGLNVAAERVFGAHVLAMMIDCVCVGVCAYVTCAVSCEIRTGPKLFAFMLVWCAYPRHILARETFAHAVRTILIGAMRRDRNPCPRFRQRRIISGGNAS